MMVFLFLLSMISVTFSFQNTLKFPLFSKSIQHKRTNVINAPYRETKLNLDFFGLGPTEVIVVIVLGAVLFGYI
jgi:hypothetical protein